MTNAPTDAIVRNPGSARYAQPSASSRAVFPVSFFAMPNPTSTTIVGPVRNAVLLPAEVLDGFARCALNEVAVQDARPGQAQLLVGSARIRPTSVLGSGRGSRHRGHQLLRP